MIYERKFENLTKVESINKKGIIFTNGMNIKDYHDQDCCEHVYAEFESLNDTPLCLEEFDYICFEGVKDSGIRIGFSKYGNEIIWCFIPCYNEQNGYYSDWLELRIEYNSEKIELDISEYVEDHID